VNFREILLDVGIFGAIICTANVIAFGMVLMAYAMTWHWVS
jgi:uncharacterized membrane protein (DUF485 family)